METQLIKMRVKEGRESRAQEWMAWLNAHKKEGIQTLKHEKVFLESVFLSREDGRMYLYYFTMASSIAYAVKRFNEQKFEADRVHRQFAEECIDTDYEVPTFEEQLVLVNIKISEH